MATAKEIRAEFMKIYTSFYDSGMTMIEAYTKAEEQFTAKYNHRKYSGFNSFNVSMYKNIKREIKRVS